MSMQQLELMSAAQALVDLFAMIMGESGVLFLTMLEILMTTLLLQSALLQEMVQYLLNSLLLSLIVYKLIVFSLLQLLRLRFYLVLLHELGDGSCRFSPRNGNKAAHILAQESITRQAKNVWLDESPSYIDSIVSHEGMA